MSSERKQYDYVDSYYAATANEKTDYPGLEGDVHCDVVVVGAGFTGISAAIILAEKGFDVRLLEASRVGWGASGRNGGHLLDGFVDLDRSEKRLGASATEMIWRMGIECRDLVVSRIDRFGIDCDLKFGHIRLALKEREIREFRNECDRYREKGYPHALRVLEANEVRDYVGSERYLGGLVNEGNGHLHPLNLCLGEAKAAESLGVRIHERSRVTHIEHQGKPCVRTPRGRVYAENVILAGNAYLDDLEPALRGMIIPASSYMMATERLSQQEAAEILPRDVAAVDQRSALDYFRLSADRRLLWGGLCNYSGLAPRSISGALRSGMVKTFPQLAPKKIDYEWGGRIGISIKRIPQFGRIGNRIWYVQGYSGHGLAPSHLAGKVLAEAVAGDLQRFDVFEKVRHLRLPGGRWFANPALALGMLYYRLKEIL